MSRNEVTMRTLNQIKPQLEVLKPILRSRFKVQTIEIFGSFARQEQKRGSDLDLLVTYAEPLDFIETYNLKKFLRKELRINVDIVSRHFLNPLIREQVLNEAIVV